MNPNLPNFFLIGCQKCATTWVHRLLQDHPQVFVPEEDEIHFFDIHHHLGLEWYRDFYTKWNGEPVVGDTTSSYARDWQTPERIYNFNPRAKILISLRNPIERAFSHYWHEKKKGKISFEFSEIHSNYDLYQSWIVPGFYRLLIERFHQCFDKNSVKVLFVEDLASNPQEFSRSIFEFLGVDSQFSSSLISQKINVAPPGVPGSNQNEYAEGIDLKRKTS